jgi:hypothetical protein
VIRGRDAESFPATAPSSLAEQEVESTEKVCPRATDAKTNSPLAIIRIPILAMSGARGIIRASRRQMFQRTRT